MRSIIHAFAAGLLSLSTALLPLGAHAGTVSTLEFAANAPGGDLHAVVQERLQAAELHQTMVKMGVDPAIVEQRIAALSDAEIAELHQRLDTLPAGSGAIEVVGLVFIVLMILELVGVTNIFTAF